MTRASVGNQCQYIGVTAVWGRSLRINALSHCLTSTWASILHGVLNSVRMALNYLVCKQNCGYNDEEQNRSENLIKMKQSRVRLALFIEHTELQVSTMYTYNNT